MKYLEFYKKCMEYGTIPDEGLCVCLPGEEISLFYPINRDFYALKHEDCSTVFWAHGIPGVLDVESRAYTFTPLRQTIVLFMAAMNNEL